MIDFSGPLSRCPQDFAGAFRFTLLEEGGYANDPIDRGGETIFGISRVFHRDWPGWVILDRYKGPDFPGSFYRSAEVSEVAGLVVTLYYQDYWHGAHCSSLPNVFQTPQFDAAVNHGARQAIRLLQRALKVTDDGVFGPVTKRAAWAAAPKVVDLLGERLEFYMSIVSGDPVQLRFAPGWSRRVLRLHEWVMTNG